MAHERPVAFSDTAVQNRLRIGLRWYFPSKSLELGQAKMVDNNKGMVLIFCVALLVILCSLGVCFLKTTIMARQAAVNYSTRLQAMLLAEAGNESAILKLQQESTRVVYSDRRPKGWLYQAALTVPLAKAQRPSFWQGQIRCGTRQFPYSGYVHDQQHCYVLKIVNTNALLNLNDPNVNLPRMLGNLCRVLGWREARVRQVISAFQKHRQPYFASVRDLLQRHIVQAQEYRQLHHFLTVASWVNPRAVKPGPWRRAGQWFAPRAPIDINTAPREVLLAVLTGISGQVQGHGHLSVDASLARYIVTKLLRRRERTQGFQSWPEIEAFLKNIGLGIPMAALIFANISPNVHLNDHNPDSCHYRLVDKLDLTRYTTEFCLGPMGYFQVTSLARVFQNGQVAAQACLERLVKIFRIMRHTSQRDFENARVAGRPNRKIALIRSGPCPVFPGNGDAAHPAMGLLFRGNPTLHCTYWSHTSNTQRWADGAGSSRQAPLVLPVASSARRGLAFFFKPAGQWSTKGRYTLYQSATPTAHGLQILTRIVYAQHLLKASRTLVIPQKRLLSAGPLPLRDSFVKIFRGATFYLDLMAHLVEKGRRIYDQHLRTYYESSTVKWEEHPYAGCRADFAQQYARRIYLAVCKGAALEPPVPLPMRYKLCKYIKSGPHWIEDVTASHQDSKLVNVVMAAALPYIFTHKPEVYLAHRSPVQPDGLQDPDIFLVPPWPHPYRYTRMQKEIHITLQPRHWYYIELCWEGMALGRFQVRTSNQRHKAGPQDRRELSNGPLNPWAIRQYRAYEQRFPVSGTFCNTRLGLWQRYPPCSRFHGVFQVPAGQGRYGLMYYTAYVPRGTRLVCTLRRPRKSKHQDWRRYPQRLVYHVLMEGLDSHGQHDHFQTPVLEDITVRLLIPPQYLQQIWH